jgi:hypothetical protein
MASPGKATAFQAQFLTSVCHRLHLYLHGDMEIRARSFSNTIKLNSKYSEGNHTTLPKAIAIHLPSLLHPKIYLRVPSAARLEITV